MRKLIVIIALFGLALPASAADCATGNIEWVETTPHLTDRTSGDNVRFDLVGGFVNYQVDDGELASTQVPESAIGVSVCPSGVTFDVAKEPVKAEVQPLIADVDADTWNDFMDENPRAAERYVSSFKWGIR